MKACNQSNTLELKIIPVSDWSLIDNDGAQATTVTIELLEDS